MLLHRAGRPQPVRAYNFPESTWVNFKLFGMIGLTARCSRWRQGFWLASKMPPTDSQLTSRAPHAADTIRVAAHRAAAAQRAAHGQRRTDRRQPPARRPCRRARRPRAFPRAHRVAAISPACAPLQRHQLVYRSLGELMQTDIHALSITALTPEEARAVNGTAPTRTPIFNTGALT